MTASRSIACGLLLSLGLCGCSRSLPPEGEASYAKTNPVSASALPGGEFDFSTSTESINLAELLKLSRAELAFRYEELKETVRRQEQLRLEGKVSYSLMPEERMPLVAPVFRDAAYSKDRGFSLPPYLRVDAHDSAVAFHLARFGDLDAALKLVEPGDEDAVRLIRDSAPEKAYPVEWTRLVAVLLHANQISLATDNKDGAKNLMALHKQLRSVLDPKAQQGPLGGALLGRGLRTLKLAAAAWKASNRDDLDTQIRVFLAAAIDVPAYTVTMPRLMDDMAQVFGARAGTMALISSSPGRVADLLNLSLPTEEADTCIAFGDDSKKVIELMFTYRPNLYDFHKPEQYAQQLEEMLAGRREDVSNDTQRRVWDLGRGRLDVTLTPRHATLGAVVRFQLPGPTRTPDLARDFGAVTLDRSFEMNRRMAAWNKRGSTLTLAGPAAAQLYNPLKSRPLLDVAIDREPNHDLVNRIAFHYADNVKDTAPAVGAIATPLFASLGRPALVFGEAGSGSIDLVWNDAKTRYRLQFPYAKDKPITLDASDASKEMLEARAKIAAATDARERLERLQAQKPFAVVPRQFEGMKLGMARAEFKKVLPRSAQLIERDIPGGLMAAFLGTPQPGDAVAREWFGQFENDKLVELRIRYVDVPSNKPGTFTKKIDAVKKKLGSPEAINVPAGPWADLPKLGNPVSYSWQDDITLLTCRQEPFGLEVSLRDCPADHPEGAPVLPLTYLGRGIGAVTLGLSKDALLKLGAQPYEGNGYIVKAAATEGFDAVVALVDHDQVSRIVARHKPGTPLKVETQASKALLEQWARDSRTIGWPNRQDSIGPNLQSLASRDDLTRFRIFWQEEPHGLSVFSEWKDVK